MPSPGRPTAGSTPSACPPPSIPSRHVSWNGSVPVAACSWCAAMRPRWKRCWCIAKATASTACASNRCSKPICPISSAPRRRPNSSSEDIKGLPMIRRLLPLALASALCSAPVLAEDLMQTYEMARQGDPVLSSAEAQRQIDREGAVQSRANLLPQLNGTVNFGRGYNAGSSVRGSNRTYGAQLSQSVFDWSTINQYRSAREFDAAGGYDLDAANDDLVVRTADAYFRVLEATETLAAAEAAEEAFQKQFDYADKRLEVGLAPITDVHEARAQYDSARASTILVRNALLDAFE